MKVKKMLARITAAGLSFIIAVSGAVSGAFAAGQTQYGMIDYLYDFKYVLANYTDDDEYTSTVKDARLLQKIADGCRNYAEVIDVSEFNLNKTQLNGAINAVMDIYPELFYVYNFNMRYLTSDPDKYVKAVPHYIYTTDDGKPDVEKIEKEVQEFYKEADRYLELVSGKLSTCKDDFSKIVLLHDEMALDCKYDYDHLDESDRQGYNNYEMLVNKSGVCRHYAEVYAYLLGQLGIHTEMITTPSSSKTVDGKSGMNHRWIKVLLDGSWYNVDLTWDDISINEKPAPGRVKHNYFLFSDTAASSFGHYGYKTIHSATNTKFDAAPFHRYISRLCKADADSNVYYAIKYVSKTMSLVSYDYSTGKETVLEDITSYNTWNLENASIKGQPQISLEYSDGMLFYNTPKEIRRYDTRTGSDIKVRGYNSSSDYQYFGLRSKNGYLYYYSGNTKKPEEFNTYSSGKLSEMTPVLESISFPKTQMTMLNGSTQELLYTATPTNAINSEYKNWDFSSDAFDYKFITSGISLTAKKTGEYTVSVKTSSGKSTACSVKVVDPAESVKLSKTAVTLGVGAKTTLSAEVSPTGCGDPVTWTSSDRTVVAVSNGVILAKKSGKATITANTLSGRKAVCTVTVNEGPIDIKLDKSTATVLKGKTVRLNATVLPDDSSSKKVVWTSSNTDIATVDSTGLVKGIKAGTVTIKAKTALNGKVAYCKVTVAMPISGVKLDKTSVSVDKGSTVTLKATVSPTAAYNKTVTWTSSNKGVATVDNNGVVTAVAKGTARIYAKTKNGMTASCTVNVTIPVTKVVLSKTSAVMKKGTSLTLTATVYPSKADDKTLTWTSTDTTVAVVDQTGKITAKAAGTAVIKAKAVNGVYGSCTVRVTIPSTAISLDKTSATVYTGKTVTLKATLTPSNTTDRITWTSSDTSIATVSNGVVTGVAEGKATITAKTTSGKTASCTVNVKQNIIKVTEIRLDNTQLTLYRNQKQEISATRYPTNATERTVNWYSDNPETVMLTVENNRVYLTALKVGTAVIRAESPDGPYATCTVTVKEPVNGAYSFDTRAGQMTITTSGGSFDIKIGNVSKPVYGGNSITFTVGTYTFKANAYPSGNIDIIETAADGSERTYSCKS